MDPDQLYDVQLIGRIEAGDQGAFAQLFDRHGAVVLGVLTRLLRRREEAEEVLQEAFLQAWEQAGRYRPRRATPRGWLLMMARARAIDRLRSREARTRREREYPAPAAADPDAPAALEAAERESTVRQALGSLPDEQRRCIELAFYEGLTHTGIAERLEEPLGTVKSRIALGMRKLRQNLAPLHGRARA
ncbi:MAG: sigma-70 family RNA polymerase sigma factor [Thermoanaerobaculia bacterium]|nr:sigma-70 family RNA polymerase sigma factor [Thermoanaerobaculia bacterium]